MLGLQALDYWIWAQANLEVLAATLADTGMPVSPSPAVFLDVVVGTETGTEPGDIRLLLPQLEALTGKMKWRIGDVTGWRSLDEPAKVICHRRGRAPRRDRRHTPPRFAFSLQNHLIRVATGEGLSEHPPFVAPGDWRLDKAWDDFQALEAAGKTHHMVGHVRSSQVFALNLFAGLNPERRTALARQVDDTIIAADPPVFEFEDDRDTLGEATHTSPHRTQVDVALPCLTEDRERVWILVEVKLTEYGFGSCSADASPNNDRGDVCATPEPFGGDPEGCFQLRNQDREHRRRYHHYLGDLNRTAALGHGCPFRHNNQPMRNFALAGVLVDRGDAARVHVVLCAHDDHRMIWRRWDEAVRDTPTADRVHVGSLTASDVLLEHPSTDAKLLATRYRIPS
jgi:hypothetical protein